VRGQLCYEDVLAVQDDVSQDVGDADEAALQHSSDGYWLQNLVLSLFQSQEVPDSAGMMIFQQIAAAVVVVVDVDTVSAKKACIHNEMAVSLEANSDWEGL
jgi:hypothetical protein